MSVVGSYWQNGEIQDRRTDDACPFCGKDGDNIQPWIDSVTIECTSCNVVMKSRLRWRYRPLEISLYKECERTVQYIKDRENKFKRGLYDRIESLEEELSLSKKVSHYLVTWIDRFNGRDLKDFTRDVLEDDENLDKEVFSKLCETMEKVWKDR